jgi:hypothetical protein
MVQPQIAEVFLIVVAIVAHMDPATQDWSARATSVRDSMYNDGSCEVQDRFDTRRLVDVLEAYTVTDEITLIAVLG